MKFGHLIGCNKRNTFLENSYAKCGEDANPRPSYKKSKMTISNSLKFYSLFMSKPMATKKY